MTDDNKCCGFHFGKDKVTIFGLLTMSLPLIFLCSVLNIMLYVISKIFHPVEKARDLVVAVQDANLRLIGKTNLASKFRCRLAGKLFLHSPKWAGIIYRNFNISFLVLFWIVALFCVYVVKLTFNK